MLSSQLTDLMAVLDWPCLQSISSMGSSETRGSTDTQKYRAGHLPDYHGEEAPERGGESVCELEREGEDGGDAVTSLPVNHKISGFRVGGAVV